MLSSWSFSLSPFFSLPWTPRGGDTQDLVESLGPRKHTAVASPGENAGQCVAMVTPQALPQGQPHPAPAFIPSLAHQILSTNCLPYSEDLVMSMAG